MQTGIKKWCRTLLSGSLILFALPAGPNYKLNGFGFGSGGTDQSSSTNYSLNGITGDPSSGKASSTNYSLGAGLTFMQQAFVPVAPSFVNTGDWYKKLLLTIDASNNAADAKFAVAISSDGFATTSYVQNDATVGPVLGSEDYRTYAAWGGSSGSKVIGLRANTVYTVKVKAIQGIYTETGFGPTAAVATSDPHLTFAIRTDSTSTPPFAVQFSDLIAGTVVAGPDKIWADFSTNADYGGRVYVQSSFTGLKSAGLNYTIPSATGDLVALNEGFGAQAVSVAETSGGPFTISPPYNVSGSNVGVLDTSIRELFSTATSIIGASGSFAVKAKASSVTPASTDYSTTLTLVAAASF